jgi:carbon-monoxide dehydrogenase iron sulfur subunit
MGKVLMSNPDKCTGCCRCEAVCSLNKRGATSVRYSRVKVIRYDMDAFFYPVFCLHCEVPYCAQVCPSGALWKNPETGVVEQEAEKCVGCKMCLMACPFGAINFVDGKAVKCDLCGGDPTCVKFCESKVLSYEEVGEATVEKRELVARRMMENIRTEQTLISGKPS